MIRADVDDHAWATSGIPQRQLPRVADEAEQAIARRGYSWIVAYLERVMRHPTGNYVSHISVVERAPGYSVEISGVVYDHWIEGTGSRNSPVTRFPGYAAFRRGGQLMEREAGRIAERIIDRWIRRNS